LNTEVDSRRTMPVRAVWNGTTIAEASDEEVELVEGNVYFPPHTLKREYLTASNSHTRCYWKGKASYYDIGVNGDTNTDAAWYYPKPSRLAKRLKDHVAFWRGVRVERD
jgi:uncharacterized protein (DUF427 family)